MADKKKKASMTIHGVTGGMGDQLCAWLEAEDVDGDGLYILSSIDAAYLTPTGTVRGVNSQLNNLLKKIKSEAVGFGYLQARVRFPGLNRRSFTTSLKKVRV